MLDADHNSRTTGTKSSGPVTPAKQSTTFSNALLTIPALADRRPCSPDTLSNLSVDERVSFQSGNGIGFISSDATSDRAVSPSTWRAKVRRIWRRNLGVSMVMLSQVFGTGMTVATRLLETEGTHGKAMHPFQILFARMSITVALSMLYMWYRRTPHYPLGAPEVRGLLVARGLGGFFGVFGLYYALVYLPLSDATVLTFLAPSLACWACSIVIKEPFTRAEQVATLVSLLGVVLIARPTSFFGNHTGSVTPSVSGKHATALTTINETASPATSAPDYENSATPGQRLGAVAMSMLGVLGAACAYTMIRWIGKRAHPLITVNYFAAWCTIVSTVMMLTVPSIGFLLPQSAYEWGLLIFLGLSGFVMQFLLAAGLQQEKGSRATNMVYSQMLFALAADKLVWGHTPGWMEFAGSGLILGSAIFVAVKRETTSVKEPVSGRRGENGAEGGEEERGLVEGMEGAENDDERASMELRTLTR